MNRVLLIAGALALLLLPALNGCENDEDCPTCPEVCGDGVIVVDTAPDSLGVRWFLEAGNGFRLAGLGDEVVADVAPGTYAVRWIRPVFFDGDEADTSVVVAAGDTARVTGTFVPVTGAIAVTVPEDPPLPFTPRWSLEGPYNRVHVGAGDTLLTDVIMGPWTVTWDEEPRWLPPDPNPQPFWVDPNETTTVFADYTDAVRWPLTADLVVENFRAIYENRLYDEFSDLLRPDFVTLLQPATQEEFPDVGPTLDYAEELVIAERMFSGQAITNSRGDLVPGVSSIRVLALERQTDWRITGPDDTFPDTRFALYDVLFLFDRQGYSTLRTEGSIVFYVARRDSVVDGGVLPYFEMVAQQDLTNTGKAIEQTSWGTIKALFW